MNLLSLVKFIKDPLVIVCVVIIVILVTQEIRIASKKSSINRLETKLMRTEQENIQIASSLRVCQTTNKKNSKQLETLELEYYRIVSHLDDSRMRQKAAVKEVKQNKITSQRVIDELKKQIKTNTCIIDTDNISLLKEANSQD